MHTMGYDFFILFGSFIFVTLFSRGSCLCGEINTNTACPEGWHVNGGFCYKFVTHPRKNREDAKKECMAMYSTLVRVDDLSQNAFISNYLETNTVNKSIEWYTSGRMNPNVFGQYIWEGHPLSQRPFNNELVGLWKLKPMPENKDETTWPIDKRYIVYKTDGKNWGFDLATPEVLRPFICMISRDDIANVGTTQRNELFGVMETATVPSAPCFVQQPQNQIYFTREFGANEKVTIVPGQFAVQYSCQASGMPRPDYSWYTVDSADTSMKRTKINPLAAEYGGRYSITGGVLVINFPISTHTDPSGLKRVQCEASNIYGSILSNQASLTFGAYADFSRAERAPKRVQAHQMATLSCSPPESLKPKSDIIFNFFQKSKNLGGGLEPIVSTTRPYVFISQGGALYFSAVTQEDDGEYVCSVSMRSVRSGGTNVQSPPMQLIVSNSFAEPQMISIQSDFPKMYPENAFRGDDIRLECFAIGRPAPFTYSWKKVGGEISNRAQLTNLNRVLLIRNAQMEDNGEYQCTVSQASGDGREGGTRSKSLTVSLNARPYFITTLSPQYVDQDSDVRFVCEGAGKPDVKFKWYRGTVPLTSGGRISITNANPGSSELSIKQTTASDAYTYSCEISNLYGASYSSAWLKVLSFRPTFSKYPLENMEGMMGQELTYKCRAEGAPEPTKKWILNGNPLTTEPVVIDTDTGKPTCKSKRCIFRNGNLKLMTLDKSDEGNYTCLATNVLGTARSSGYLSVMSKPEWTLEPENRAVRLNTTVDIPCLAESNAHLDINYAWYFENIKLKFDRLDLDERRYDTAQLLRPYGRNFGSLRIENVQFENEGHYECRLSTPIGTLMRSAWIRVTGPPGPPAGVVATTADKSPDITVRWVKGTAHHDAILSYIIEAARTLDPVWMNVTSVAEPNPVPKTDFREGKFRGLAANTAYLVRVRAVNSLGIGEASPASDSFTTASSAPFKKPENVTGGGGKMKTLVVRWNVIPKAFYNGKDFKYLIGYKDPSNRKWIEEAVDPSLLKELNRGKQLEHTFTLPEGTADYTLYDVRVGSRNQVGAGPYSDVKQARSAERVPTSTPKDVVAAPFNSTALTVRWIRPRPNLGEGPILGYRIIYWPKLSTCADNSHEKARFGIRQTIWGDVNEGKIIGLQMDQYYCIVGQVFNNAGDGPESGVTEQTTFKKPPTNFPTMVKLHYTGRPRELKVTWVGLFTLPQEESLEGYKIRLWRAGTPVTVYNDYDFGLDTVGYLEKLDYGQRYDMRVFGYSRGGVGAMSSPKITFLLERKQDCIPGRYKGVDVEYFFLCANCSRIQSSMIVLLLSFLTALFSRN